MSIPLTNNCDSHQMMMSSSKLFNQSLPWADSWVKASAVDSTRKDSFSLATTTQCSSCRQRPHRDKQQKVKVANFARIQLTTKLQDCADNALSANNRIKVPVLDQLARRSKSRSSRWQCSKTRRKSLLLNKLRRTNKTWSGSQAHKRISETEGLSQLLQRRKKLSLSTTMSLYRGLVTRTRVSLEISKRFLLGASQCARVTTSHSISLKRSTRKPSISNCRYLMAAW